MPGAKDIIYLYDGTLSGLYCAVYECYYSHTLPVDILPSAEAPFTLMDQFLVETDPQKAQSVRRSLPKNICPEALDLVENVFLSCLAQKELHILRFLIRGYAQGKGVMALLGDPVVQPLLKAQRHLLFEAHQLTGFVRFGDYEGVLAATISPKNFVLPYIANHFCNRYSNENFIIFDKTHRAALLYQERQRQIVAMDSIAFPRVSPQEEQYQRLWKRFFATVAIEARTNPRCQMNHLPKRFWENMSEMQDFL